MAEVIIKDASKAYDDVVAVERASLRVRDGEFMVLLGPSGCGKTTLLRAIAGLGMLDSGTIAIGGRDVTYVPPKDRGVSMVFQSYAIFPHLNIRDNIAFGLKIQKLPKPEIKARVRHAAELLHLDDLLERSPAQLSGGERQRVAVARAIAMQSRLILMDEPLSNLDVMLRMEMRVELKRLVRKIDATVIYVTHDQTEALNMGDRIAVMREGTIIQVGTPAEIYDRPAERFVGGFIGHPPMNFLEGHLRRRNGSLKAELWDDMAVTPPPAMQGVLAPYEGQIVVAGIRAEHIDVSEQPVENALKTRLISLEALGARNLLQLRLGQNVIQAYVEPDVRPATNQHLWLRFPAEKIRWMDRATERALHPVPDSTPAATS